MRNPTRVAGCNHSFCYQCVSSALDRPGSSKCPTCGIATWKKDLCPDAHLSKLVDTISNLQSVLSRYKPPLPCPVAVPDPAPPAPTEASFPPPAVEAPLARVQRSAGTLNDQAGQPSGSGRGQGGSKRGSARAKRKEKDREADPVQGDAAPLFLAPPPPPREVPPGAFPPLPSKPLGRGGTGTRLRRLQQLLGPDDSQTDSPSLSLRHRRPDPEPEPSPPVTLEPPLPATLPLLPPTTEAAVGLGPPGSTVDGEVQAPEDPPAVPPSSLTFQPFAPAALPLSPLPLPEYPLPPPHTEGGERTAPASLQGMSPLLDSRENPGRTSRAGLSEGGSGRTTQTALALPEAAGGAETHTPLLRGRRQGTLDFHATGCGEGYGDPESFPGRFLQSFRCHVDSAFASGAPAFADEEERERARREFVREEYLRVAIEGGCLEFSPTLAEVFVACGVTEQKRPRNPRQGPLRTPMIARREDATLHNHAWTTPLVPAALNFDPYRHERPTREGQREGGPGGEGGLPDQGVAAGREDGGGPASDVQGGAAAEEREGRPLGGCDLSAFTAPTTADTTTPAANPPQHRSGGDGTDPRCTLFVAGTPLTAGTFVEGGTSLAQGSDPDTQPVHPPPLLPPYSGPIVGLFVPESPAEEEMELVPGALLTQTQAPSLPPPSSLPLLPLPSEGLAPAEADEVVPATQADTVRRAKGTAAAVSSALQSLPFSPSLLSPNKVTALFLEALGRGMLSAEQQEQILHSLQLTRGAVGAAAPAAPEEEEERGRQTAAQVQLTAVEAPPAEQGKSQPGRSGRGRKRMEPEPTPEAEGIEVVGVTAGRGREPMEEEAAAAPPPAKKSRGATKREPARPRQGDVISDLMVLGEAAATGGAGGGRKPTAGGGVPPGKKGKRRAKGLEVPSAFAGSGPVDIATLFGAKGEWGFSEAEILGASACFLDALGRELRIRAWATSVPSSLPTAVILPYALTLQQAPQAIPDPSPPLRDLRRTAVLAPVPTTIAYDRELFDHLHCGLMLSAIAAGVPVVIREWLTACTENETGPKDPRDPRYSALQLPGGGVPRGPSPWRPLLGHVAFLSPWWNSDDLGFRCSLPGRATRVGRRTEMATMYKALLSQLGATVVDFRTVAQSPSELQLHFNRAAAAAPSQLQEPSLLCILEGGGTAADAAFECRKILEQCEGGGSAGRARSLSLAPPPSSRGTTPTPGVGGQGMTQVPPISFVLSSWVEDSVLLGALQEMAGYAVQQGRGKGARVGGNRGGPVHVDF